VTTAPTTTTSTPATADPGAERPPIDLTPEPSTPPPATPTTPPAAESNRGGDTGRPSVAELRRNPGAREDRVDLDIDVDNGRDIDRDVTEPGGDT
jgi:hypothetical protein